MIRRAGRDSEVNLRLVHFEFDATVLGNALFGDVDARHQFEASKNCGLHPLGEVVPNRTDPIDPVTQHNSVGHGLNVNVRSAVANRFLDDPVHQRDHARVFSRIHIDGCVHRPVNRRIHGGINRVRDETLAIEGPPPALLPSRAASMAEGGTTSTTSSRLRRSMSRASRAMGSPMAKLTTILTQRDILNLSASRRARLRSTRWAEDFSFKSTKGSPACSARPWRSRCHRRRRPPATPHPDGERPKRLSTPLQARQTKEPHSGRGFHQV